MKYAIIYAVKYMPVRKFFTTIFLICILCSSAISATNHAATDSTRERTREKITKEKRPKDSSSGSGWYESGTFINDTDWSTILSCCFSDFTTTLLSSAAEAIAEIESKTSIDSSENKSSGSSFSDIVNGYSEHKTSVQKENNDFSNINSGFSAYLSLDINFQSIPGGGTDYTHVGSGLGLSALILYDNFAFIAGVQRSGASTNFASDYTTTIESANGDITEYIDYVNNAELYFTTIKFGMGYFYRKQTYSGAEFGIGAGALATFNTIEEHSDFERDTYFNDLYRGTSYLRESLTHNTINPALFVSLTYRPPFFSLLMFSASFEHNFISRSPLMQKSLPMDWVKIIGISIFRFGMQFRLS